jgi:hypothetical protein
MLRCLRAAGSPAALALVLGCAGATPPPGPGESTGRVPELRGQSVMVLPFQIRRGIAGDPDAELAFALATRDPAVEWILPETMRAALRASPGLDARLEDLPVDVFLQTEVDRVGDPVFGVLRRLGALTGSDLALLPVLIAATSGPDGGAPSVEIAVALIAIRSGRVLWYGVEAGAGAGSDPAALAGAMEALGRRLVPTARGAGDTDEGSGR